MKNLDIQGLTRQATIALFLSGIAILITDLMVIILSNRPIVPKVIGSIFVVSMAVFMLRFWLYHTIHLEGYPMDLRSLIYQVLIAISFLALLGMIPLFSVSLFLFFMLITSHIDLRWCEHELNRLRNGRVLFEKDALREWYVKQFEFWQWGAANKRRAAYSILVISPIEVLERVHWKESVINKLFGDIEIMGTTLDRYLTPLDPNITNIIYGVMATFILFTAPRVFRIAIREAERKPDSEVS